MTSPSHGLSPSSSSQSTSSFASRLSPGSIFYDVLPTPYGGRGAFAKKQIPKNTTILQCQGPYASVILRKFRKEVCAWCFAWCFESGEGRKSTWSVRLDGSAGESGGQKRKGGNGAAWTVWFCGEGCREDWIMDYSLDGEGSGLDSLATLMNTLEKTLVTYRNNKSRAKSQNCFTVTPPPPHAFAFLDTWTSSDVTEPTIDLAWQLAESLTDNLKKPTVILEMLDAWNAASADDPTELLTEFEADCARFVLDGILRQALQLHTATGSSLASSYDGSPTMEDTHSLLADVKSAGLWQDLLQLQNNEFQHVKTRPYMLGVFIRVYLFLKYVVLCAKPLKKKARAAQHSTDDTTAKPALLESLETLFQTSNSVRAILARDHGNVFGIWEKGPSCTDGGDDDGNEGDESGEDGEMFGWGMFVFGSYFNHDCTPTVRKDQQGRSLHFVTLRDIEQGEELCINYIDVSKGNGVVSRNAELRKEWFFECGCKRCGKERGELVSA